MTPPPNYGTLGLRIHFKNSHRAGGNGFLREQKAVMDAQERLMIDILQAPEKGEEAKYEVVWALQENL